jgi:hypothetical protein
MREMLWRPVRPSSGLLINTPRLQAHALRGLGQTLISGDLDAALSALAAGAPMLGLYALASGGAYSLRIARDRALLVTSLPIEAAGGWRDGWCATSLDDAFAAIDVSGPDAPLALAQGTSADIAANSPSAAVRFAGLCDLLLMRTSTGFRIHLEAPWVETLLTWLEGV